MLTLRRFQPSNVFVTFECLYSPKWGCILVISVVLVCYISSKFIIVSFKGLLLVYLMIFILKSLCQHTLKNVLLPIIRKFVLQQIFVEPSKVVDKPLIWRVKFDICLCTTVTHCTCMCYQCMCVLYCSDINSGGSAWEEHYCTGARSRHQESASTFHVLQCTSDLFVTDRNLYHEWNKKFPELRKRLCTGTSVFQTLWGWEYLSLSYRFP